MTSSVWDHLALVTPPPAGDAGMIVSVAEAMTQCRVMPNAGLDETQWFIDAIYTAQQAINGPLGGGVPLLTQQWRLSLDRWPRDYIQIPMGPVQSIDSITYLDLAYSPNVLPAGDPTTGANGQYVFDLDASPVHIRRAFGVVWPLLGIIPGAVKVLFTCGFAATPEAWPDDKRDLKQAIKLLVSHYYNHRDAVVGVEGRDSSTALPLGVDYILDRYRVGKFG